MTSSTPDAAKACLVELFDELLRHDGYGDLAVEMRILKRGQKEVLLRCGKQYRFVVDFEPSPTPHLPPPALNRKLPMTTALLSERLRTETAALHERMHQLMGSANPFADRDAYARFVAVQYLFQRDIAPLFADPSVAALLPDVDTRGRERDARADLADLGVAVPTDTVAGAAVTMPAALGWLYVSEGSTLGAALLLKEAKDKLGLSETFGARNLAAYPGGRAPAWKRFVAALDAANYAREDQDRVVAGAVAAFERFGQLIQRHFGELAPAA